MKERLAGISLVVDRGSAVIYCLVVALGFLVLSCVSSQETNQKKPKLSSEAMDKADLEDDGKDELTLSSSLKPLTISLSNNKYTSGNINKQKVADFTQKLEANMMKDKNALSEKNYASTLTTLMAGQRLAGSGVSTILETARKYIAIGMKKNVNKQLPAFSKLDVALAAIKEKKLALAEYFLNELLEEKQVPKEIKAGSYTALGMIAMGEGRIPEAVEQWKKALSIDSDYKPALLNIGFVATQYGDVKTAQQALTRLSSDWYALSGLIVVDRFSSDTSRISGMCSKVLSKNKAHKPALISCGFYELQINKDIKAAKSYASKALAITTGVVKLDDAAGVLLSSIEKAQTDISRQKDLEKQEKLKQEQEAKKNEQEAKKSQKASSEEKDSLKEESTSKGE